MPQVHSDLDGIFLRKFHFGIFSVFCDADGSILIQSPEFVSNAVLGFAPCPENSRPSHEPWKKLSNALLHQLLSLFAIPCGVVSGKFYPQHVFHNIEYGRLDSVSWLFSSHPTCPSLTLGLSWQANSADSAQLIHLKCHPCFVCFCLGEAPHFTHLGVWVLTRWWWPSVKLGSNTGGASLGPEPAWPGAGWMLQAMLLIFNGDGAAAVGVNGWQTDGTGRW